MYGFESARLCDTFSPFPDRSFLQCWARDLVGAVPPYNPSIKLRTSLSSWSCFGASAAAYLFAVVHAGTVDSETTVYAELDGGVKPWSERLQDVRAINADRNEKVKIELECKKNNVSAKTMTAATGGNGVGMDTHPCSLVLPQIVNLYSCIACQQFQFRPISVWRRILLVSIESAALANAVVCPATTS